MLPDICHTVAAAWEGRKNDVHVIKLVIFGSTPDSRPYNFQLRKEQGAF